MDTTIKKPLDMPEDPARHPLGVVDENAALRLILEGTATATGEKFVEALVMNLSKALNTHSAWVTEYLEETNQLHALAFWINGQLLRNELIDIEGTPCEAVIASTELVHYPDNILHLFPQETYFRDIGAASYMGVPLLGSDGKILGNLAVLDTRPMPRDPRAEAIIRIFGNRAAAELQRIRAERRVHQSEVKYRRIIESTAEGFLLMDGNYRITDVNQAFCEMVGYSREEILGRTPLKFADEDYRQFLIHSSEEGMFSDRLREFEGAMVTKSGKKIPVLAHGNTLRDDGGGVIGNMLFVFDMTQPKRSLALAAEVQKSLLPCECPRVDGLDVAGRVLNCDEIGGDYYDFPGEGECSLDRFNIVVGDVTGHGVDAALLMTTARAFLRMRAAQCDEISKILTEMNRHLALDVHDSGRFMTLFFLQFDLANRQLNWVRAGHPPALLYDPAADRFVELMGEGLALGVEEDYAYRQFRRDGLASGQIVALGTDGILEATDRNGRLYGKRRFREAIRANAGKDATGILEAVFADLKQFALGTRVQDDATLVIAKVKPLMEEHGGDWQI
ncbi:MAG TPA: SpoIIE family protein phosphatase [Desulfobacterales bacterium]